jgi:hypothetical protein
VKDRTNEEEIRTRLRELTDESRRLRQELSEMLTAHETAARRFLDRKTWTKRPSQPLKSQPRAKRSRIQKSRDY